MINIEKLKPILAGYKVYFPSHWDDEKYKWEAVQCLQLNWDVNSDDFIISVEGFSSSNLTPFDNSSGMDSESERANVDNCGGPLFKT